MDTAELEKEMIDHLGYQSHSSADDEKNCNMSNDEKGRYSGLLEVYKNNEEISRMFQMGYLLSVVWVVCGSFYCFC